MSHGHPHGPGAHGHSHAHEPADVALEGHAHDAEH
jgi:hypothetical protein